MLRGCSQGGNQNVNTSVVGLSAKNMGQRQEEGGRLTGGNVGSGVGVG